MARAPAEVRGPYGWSKGGWIPPEDSGLLSGEDFARMDTLSDVALDWLYRNRALDYMKTHPGEVLALVGHKMMRLWEIPPPGGSPGRWFFLGPYYAVLALAVGGAWLGRRRWRALLPLILAAGAILLSVAVTWGNRRFRHPLEPVLLLLAGVALASLAELNAWTRLRLRFSGHDHSGFRLTTGSAGDTIPGTRERRWSSL